MIEKLLPPEDPQRQSADMPTLEVDIINKINELSTAVNFLLWKAGWEYPNIKAQRNAGRFKLYLHEKAPLTEPERFDE